MARELKIWLDDESHITGKLKSLGAVFEGITDTVHTYFNQPDGQVLKLVDSGSRTTLDRLKRQGKQFVFAGKEPVADRARMLQELTDEYGVKAVLIMHARSYRLHDYEVALYDIQDVGKFLILTGEDPTIELLDKWFGLKSPKIVTVSFDNL